MILDSALLGGESNNDTYHLWHATPFEESSLNFSELTSQNRAVTNASAAVVMGMEINGS